MNRIRRLIRWVKSPSKKDRLSLFEYKAAVLLFTIKKEIAYGQASHAAAVRMGSDSTYWKGYTQAMHALLEHVEGMS